MPVGPDSSDLVSPASSSRLAGIIAMFVGVTAIATGWVLAEDLTSTLVRHLFGGSLVVLGAVLFIRWLRLEGYPRGLAVVTVAYALIGLFDGIEGLTAYSYPVLFILISVWIGLTRERCFTWLSAPILILAYLLPKLDEPVALQSAIVAIPVCLLISEIISRNTHRLRHSRRVLADQATLFRAVADAARSISALETETVVPQILAATRAIGFDGAGLNEVIPERNRFRVLASAGLGPDLDGREFPLDSGLAGEVFRQDRPVVWHEHQPGDTVHRELARRGLKTVVAVPVRVNGVVRAVLLGGHHKAIPVRPENREAMDILAFEAGVALQNAVHFEQRSEDARQAEDRARLDPLTGLGNRRVMDQLLSGLDGDDVLMLVDLDHFKWVNDEYGHDEGDRILEAMGRFLQANLRDGDVATRYGGEEFLLFLPGLNGKVADLGTRLLDVWRETGPVTTFSVGAACHRPEEHGQTTLKRADQALYRAKQAGRNRLVIFQ